MLVASKSDQHQYSHINTKSREKVTRVYKMINKGKMLWSLTKDYPVKSPNK